MLPGLFSAEFIFQKPAKQEMSGLHYFAHDYLGGNNLQKQLYTYNRLELSLKNDPGY